MSYSIQRYKEKGSESTTAVQDVSQLVWREEGEQIDLNTCNLDPIVSLFLSLCRLCVVEKVFIGGGLIDVVSPQLSCTVAWGLSQVTHPYIHLSEDCYDQVTPYIPLYDYSETSEERTLWERHFCPLFGGCPLLGGCLIFTLYPPLE